MTLRIRHRRACKHAITLADSSHSHSPQLFPFAKTQKDRNVVADKLAALGHSLTRARSMFAIPPGSVAVMVEEEQACWEEPGDQVMAG
ncbi:hypothetical protein V6N13_053237 [Hibiscus sabdariffa]